MTDQASSQILTQTNYSETKYEDQTFELVGESNPNETFVPMDIEVIHLDRVKTDPMFADYGGISTNQEARRWHLPEHLAYVAQGEEESSVDAGPQKVELLPDELEQLRQQAFQQGREEAIAEAVAANTEKLMSAERAVNQIIDDLQKQFAEAIQHIEQEALKFSLAVSHKIVGSTVEINPEYIQGIIQQALGKTGSAKVLRVRVSPQDLEFIQLIGFAREVKGYDGSWKFEADPGIASGCVVDTAAGEVDFQLDAAWERIRDQVLKVVR